MTKSDIQAALNRSMVAGLVIGVAVGILTFAAGVLGGVGVLDVRGVLVLTVCFVAAGGCCAVFVLSLIVRAQKFRVTDEHLLMNFAYEVMAAYEAAGGKVFHLPVDAALVSGAYLIPMLGRRHEGAKGLEGIDRDLPRLKKLLGERVGSDLVRYNALLNWAVADLQRRFIPEELNYLVRLVADWQAEQPDSLLDPAAGLRDRGAPMSFEQYAEQGLLPSGESLKFLGPRIAELTMLDQIALAYLGESTTYQHMLSEAESGLKGAAA